MVLGKPIAVRFDKVIYKAANLVDGQICTGMRIKQSGLIDVLLLTGESGIDHKLMDTDLTHIQSSQLVRQITDVARLDAASIG